MHHFPRFPSYHSFSLMFNSILSIWVLFIYWNIRIRFLISILTYPPFFLFSIHFFFLCMVFIFIFIHCFIYDVDNWCYAISCTVEFVSSFVKLRLWCVCCAKNVCPWEPWILLPVYLWWSKYAKYGGIFVWNCFILLLVREYLSKTVSLRRIQSFEAIGRGIECGSNFEEWEMMYMTL